MFFHLSLQLLFLYPEIINSITVDLENILWETFMYTYHKKLKI